MVGLCYFEENCYSLYIELREEMVEKNPRNKKLLRILILAAILLSVALVVFLLVRWTDSIEERRKEAELKETLRAILEERGERGVLELVGVNVNNIYYGEDGITIFEGDASDWDYSADEMQNMAVWEKANRSVVYIETGAVDELGAEVGSAERGTGSGVILSANGYILTNEHVIRDAEFIRIGLADGTECDALLVGVDSENDIAVLKIDPGASRLEPITFGSSENLRIGQKVIAIGNPFGYDRTMSIGILSGLGRAVRDAEGRVLMGMIQTDAEVNPGNSGGPLLNGKGEMIGMNSSIYSTSGTSEGLNFAIPIDTIAQVVPELIENGSVRRGWFDMVAIQLTQEIVEYSGLPISDGLLVSQVLSGGRAEASGLRGGTERVMYGSSIIYLGGDVITEINGVEITDDNDIFEALLTTKPGDRVPVTVYRSGSRVNLEVELVERTDTNTSWIVR